VAKLLPRGLQAGAAIELPGSRAFLVGRESDDLPVADPSVSREHATLEREGARWVLRDLDSGNGTFVNGRRVSRRRLSDGDLVRFGPTAEFRFIDEEDRPAWRGKLLSLVRLSLVARDPEFRPARLTIRRAPIVVGRGAQAALRLPVPQVSEVHARVENRAGCAFVSDHRSSNGTWVNGERVKERRLWPGDELAFADQPFDVAPTMRPTTRGAVLAVAVVLVALAGGATAVWQGREGGAAESLWTRQMYEEQAQVSLGDAIAAYDRRPPAVDVARAQFDIALRSLIAADRLRPDRRTPEEVAAAFREAARPLGGVLGGRDPYRIWESLQKREDRTEVPDQGDVVAAELSRILAEFGIDTQETAVPVDLVTQVREFVEWWTTDKRDYTLRSIERGRPHLGAIRAELSAAHLPEVFCYLPFIESGYQADISSPAGARGLWQFMPKTARSYGLRVDDDVDERIDPAIATRAACRYIDGLLSAFGANAFMCAIAAYNKGEYGMVTCLKKISWRSQWKFWDMVERRDGCLKQETIDYVPKFLAAAIVMRRPESFGLLDGATR
jgi:pSer/pThr/pTyr-binding forkhead associated (FHA) protein